MERILYVLLPWITKVNVNVSLPKFKTENTALIVYKIRLKNILDDHQNRKLIYTDASKPNNGVGLSTISNNLKSLHKLPLHASIFTTKSLATDKAIEHIYNNTENPNTNYILLSDSLGSFNACFNST